MSAIFLKIKKILSREAKQSRGITLVETIIYMAVLVFVMVVIVQMLVSIGSIYKEIKITRELESSGAIVMESILREIYNADSVKTDESVLSVSPGKLALVGTNENQTQYKTVFDVSGGAIRISKNGELPNVLTSGSVKVSNLIFTRVVSGKSEGVKIELEIKNASGTNEKTEKFYGFMILRGSY